MQYIKAILSQELKDINFKFNFCLAELPSHLILEILTIAEMKAMPRKVYYLDCKMSWSTTYIVFFWLTVRNGVQLSEATNLQRG